MLIRKLMAPEGVSDMGGGGGDPAPAAPAAPARARMSDIGSLPTAKEPAYVPQPSREPRSSNYIPGDEGVRPAGDDGDLDPGETPPELDAFGHEPLPDAQTEERVEEEPGEFDGLLYGVAPDELFAMLRERTLPAEVALKMLSDAKGTLSNEAAAQVFRDVKIDGETFRLSLPDLEKHAMRGITFSRKTREVAAIRRQAEGVIAQDKQRWDRWQQDPSTMYTDLDSRGMIDIPGASGPLYEIAMHIAEQRRAWLAMGPVEQRAYIREQEAERRLAAAEARTREADERDQGARRQQTAQTFREQLAQMTPLAMQKFGIEPSERAKRYYREELSAIADRLPKGQPIVVTQAMCDEAAEYARECLIEDARRGGAPVPARGAAPPARAQQPQRRPQGGALPPTALPGGRSFGNPQAPRTVKRARMSDMEKVLRPRR